MAFDLAKFKTDFEQVKDKIEIGLNSGVLVTKDRNKVSSLLVLISGAVENGDGLDHVSEHLSELYKRLHVTSNNAAEGNVIIGKIVGLKQSIPTSSMIGSIFKRAGKGLGDAFGQMLKK